MAKLVSRQSNSGTLGSTPVFFFWLCWQRQRFRFLDQKRQNKHHKMTETKSLNCHWEAFGLSCLPTYHCEPDGGRWVDGCVVSEWNGSLTSITTSLQSAPFNKYVSGFVSFPTAATWLSKLNCSETKYVPEEGLTLTSICTWSINLPGIAGILYWCWSINQKRGKNKIICDEKPWNKPKLEQLVWRNVYFPSNFIWLVLFTELFTFVWSSSFKMKSLRDPTMTAVIYSVV